MPTTTVDQWDSREALLALQVDEVTPVVPAAATAGFYIHDGESQIENEERTLNRDRPNGGSRKRKFVRKHGIVTGDIELSGAAIAGDPSPYSAVYQNCGHAETLVADAGPPIVNASDYTPILRGFPSASMWFYHSGELQKMFGGRGVLESMTWALDDFNRARMRWGGRVEAVDEADVPTNVDKTAFRDPLAGSQASMKFMLDGVEIDGFGLDLSNAGAVNFRWGSASTLTMHNDRDWTGTLKIWRPLVAESPIQQMIDSEAEIALELVYEDTQPENRASLLLPTIQMGQYRRTNQENKKAWEIPIFALNASTDYRIRFGG